MRLKILSMIVKRKLTLLIVFILFAYGCSAAYQAVKRGDELLQMKNYYGASQEYLSALRLEHDNKDAKMKLCQNSRQAYEQKLSIAENAEKTSDFESAMRQYSDLANFLDRVSSYNCLNFAAINARAKITEMKSSSSEKYYKEAESLFAGEDYSNAISRYRDALRHNNPYKDSIEKIAESYYRIAKKFEAQRGFRNAAKNYENANITIKGYKDAVQKAVHLYYSLGDYFLSKQLCRNAWNDFNEVTRIKPDFKNVNEKIKEAETCSVTKIAFIKFDNPTGKNIGGASMGDLVFDEIKSSLQKRASQFIRFMDRDELGTILSEQKLGMSGITDEYSTFKRLKGVHYLIFGKLSQVYFDKPVPKQESRQTTGTVYYDCTKYNKGKPYNATCDKNENVYFKQISESINVSLTGSMKVLSVSSGEQVIYHNINVKKGDSVTYATDFSKDISQVKVASAITALADARRDLTGEDSIMKSVVNAIANDMIRQILDKIDRPQSATDPVELKAESETPKVVEREVLQPAGNKALKEKKSMKR